MIKNLNYCAENGTLITYEKDHQKYSITFSDVSGLWQYANEYNFGGGCSIAKGKYIFAAMTTASGQGGIVFAWDTDAQKVVHLSDGEYCVALDFFDSRVWVLRMVSCWGVPAHFAVDSIPFGTMDISAEATPVNAPLPAADAFDGTHIEFSVGDDGIRIDM